MKSAMHVMLSSVDMIMSQSSGDFVSVDTSLCTQKGVTEQHVWKFVMKTPRSLQDRANLKKGGKRGTSILTIDSKHLQHESSHIYSKYHGHHRNPKQRTIDRQQLWPRIPSQILGAWGRTHHWRSLPRKESHTIHHHDQRSPSKIEVVVVTQTNNYQSQKPQLC